jgi:hypothetical protein
MLEVCGMRRVTLLGSALGYRALSLAVNPWCPMEYYLFVHGVVETPGYLKDAEAIFTVAEREAVVSMVASDPECGEIMQGTGGVRKVRVGRGSRGKSGGARLVYIHHDADHPVFLLAAFAKNERSNLSKAERNELAAFVKMLFKPTGGKL